MRKLLLFSLLPLLGSCQTLQDPDASGARDHYERARAEISLIQAEGFLEAGDPAAARRELAGVAPALEDVRVHLVLARSLIIEGRYAEAQAEIDGAEILAPDTLEVHLVRGMLEEARGRFSKAVLAYGLAAEHDPEALDPVLRQTRALLALGDAAEAVSLLERQAGRLSESFELLLALGDAHVANGGFEAAVGYYRTATDFRPDDDDLHQRMVLALALAGHHAEAAESGRRLAPDFLPDHLNLALGRSALVAGRPQQARRHLERYLELHPGDDDAWADLARTEFLLGEPRRVLQTLREALTRDPGDYRSLVLLGHLRSQAGQHQEALNSYLEAIRLGADAAPLTGIMERLVAQLRPTIIAAAPPLPAPEPSAKVAADPGPETGESAADNSGSEDDR